MKKKLDANNFRTVLLKAIEATYLDLVSTIQNAHLYVFGIWVNGEGSSINPIANTEEYLLEKAIEYTKIYNKPIEYYLKYLRWHSLGDWKYNLMEVNYFELVNNILSEGWNEDFSEYLFDQQVINEICINALIELQNQKGAIP